MKILIFGILWSADSSRRNSESQYDFQRTSENAGKVFIRSIRKFNFPTAKIRLSS